MENEYLIKELYEKLRRLEEAEKDWEEEIHQSHPREGLERKADEAYNDYWQFIFNEVEKKYQLAVERQIGKDHFVDKRFIDTLAEIIEVDDSILCETDDHYLKKSISKDGCFEYWVYQFEDSLILDCLDAIDDDSAVITFKNLFDNKW